VINHPSYKFFEEHWNDPKHHIHCSAVLKACLGMIQDTDLNPEVFIVAAWIHDMGKLRDKENHHVESMHYLDLFMQEYPQFRGIYDTVKDCIIHHRTHGTPQTLYGQIFQVADKVALENKGWKKFKKAQK